MRVNRSWQRFPLPLLQRCAGRAPQPATFQSEDENLDCPAIFAEISSNKRRIEELGGEGRKANALQYRQSYIAKLTTQKTLWRRATAACGSDAAKAQLNIESFRPPGAA
jgi:hypothetical protein